MDNFRIYFKNTVNKSNDRFTIAVNHCIINEYALDTELVEFEHDLEPGWNTLEISFDRTQPDSGVGIDEVYINRSAMKYLLNDYGTVIPDWSRDPLLQQWFVKTQGHAPESFPKRKILDMPGVYEFRFLMPLRDFFNDFYQIPEHYKQQYNQPIERYSRLEEMLQNAKSK